VIDWWYALHAQCREATPQMKQVLITSGAGDQAGAG